MDRTPLAARTPTSTKTSTAIGPQLYCTVVGGTHSEAGPTATAGNRDSTDSRDNSNSMDANSTKVMTVKTGRTAKT